MSGEPHVRIDRGRLAEPRLPKPDERETFGPALGAWGTQPTPSQPPTSPFKTFSRSALDGPCGVLFLKSSCWSNNSLVHTNEARLAWQSSELIAQQENLGLFRGFVHLGDAEEFKGAPKRR